MNTYASQCAHGSLYDLRGKGIGRTRGEVDMLDAEPVRRPEDRPQVARILHAVEEEAEAVGLLRDTGLGEAKDGEL